MPFLRACGYFYRMKLFFNLLAAMGLMTLLASCTDSETLDEEKPTITVNYAQGFPQACAVLQRGQTYTFRAQVSDNLGLASYSLGVHHNFDQHTHDDQEAECEMDAMKSPTNPLTLMNTFTIEGSPTESEITITVSVPNDVDPGDYHCGFSVTDVTGWQSRTSVDIKIAE